MTGHPEPTIADALEFVARHPTVFLLSHRADGRPTGYPMMARVRDGTVEFSTYRASAKVRNILRDGSASVLAVAFGSGDPRVAIVSGPVEAVEESSWAEPAPSREGPAADHATDPGARVPATVVERVGARHRSGKRIVLRVTVEQARFSTRAAAD